MNYLFFWIKVAVRRFVSLFKSSPVIIIGAVVITAAFITARKEIVIALNTQKLIFATLFFILVSLLLLFKKYPANSLLIIYSKSRLKNKTVKILFYIKQAFFNNILFFLFIIAVLKGMVEIENLAVLFIAAVCSVVLSLLLMYLKNEYISRKVRKTSMKRTKFRPVIKSAFHDYFTSDFLQTAAVSIVLFVIITVEFIKNNFSFSAPESVSILLIGMVVILSVGFAGIIDSISRINWKFLSVISPKNYHYHFTRSVLFLAAFFGVLIALFILMAAFSGILHLLKYLYCILVLLMLSINISFTIGCKILKGVMFILAIALTVWISALHIAFLPILAIPVLITFLKAKNEYREWYYL